ncbi:Gfa-like protein [Labilithrix luteola]|uniref:Gfa-like protein n=1 Tax=Labilithrix luteola TaxID=1391654 RepID=A0A0K1QDP5_9BACT|nr:GFA family protein [Labilithrix luteola]AKV03884.1 Gfa-like protein [Labilithrix luteola]
MGHQADGTKKHVGSCHCGAVRFEVDVDLSEGASGCNCSICTKIASLGAIVKPNAFTLLAGEESLSTYVWGAKISTRYFCKNCGVHCFGRGHLAEVGGDYVSVNVNTLDDIDLSTMALAYWDGRNNNWQSGTRKTRWPNTPSAS